MIRRAMPFLMLVMVYAVPAAAQTDADFFNDDRLGELRLYVHSHDWQALRDRFYENTYCPADLHWGGTVVRNVGIRSRGKATRNGIKPGLRVDMNYYASEQEFLGLTSFVLDNHATDVSMLHDRLAMRFFQRMGIPAPRAAHVRLFVNDEFAGVYSVVEPIDKRFIARVFSGREDHADHDGYLFEYKHLFQYYFTYLGPDLEAYQQIFEARTHEREAPETIWRPIEEMARAVNEDSAVGIVQAVSPFLDIERFVRHVAVESFLAEYDGILGHWGMANFYLYRFKDNQRSQFLVWDKDYAFMAANHPIFWNVDGNALFRQLLQVPELRTLYLDTLADAARSAVDGATEDSKGWLEAEIDRQSAQIREAVKEDPLQRETPELFDEEIGRLREFAVTRTPFVRCEIESSRNPNFRGECLAPNRFPALQQR